ncbi:MAG: phosphoadenosine phosphosulfate reductase family protein [Planctomycetota bacterium]|jgi:3'-phosphoadenosine 5'-phosphosulfate sulfotransferase (PAPS reductase)/FAD synthetase|nr:phosphoadenosine phosphosulfate reductase family protein [Planctomycetota bacterium]
MTRAELDEILDGRRLVVSVSGGKDSTATCLHLMEMGYSPDEFDRVFFDTGWEHQATLDYLRGDLAEHVGPIEWLQAEIELTPEQEAVALELEAGLGQSPSPMIRLCVKKAMFPGRVHRWCTQSLKVKPATDRMKGLPVVNAVGIRGEESRARSIMPEWEYVPSFKVDVWRPLLRWTYEDVIAIHQRANLKPNPLYLAKAERVGCWPCIFARKSEIRWMAQHTPQRIEFLSRMEERIAELQFARREAAGKPRMSAAAWFQNKRPRMDPETGKRDGSCMPIKTVVGWSRTSRGGRQVELFTDTDGHQGCVRWGMCETGESMNKGEES